MRKPDMCYECKYFESEGSWKGQCTHPDFQGKRFRFSNSHACDLAEPVDWLGGEHRETKEGREEEMSSQNNQNQKEKEVMMEAPVSFNVKFNYKGFDSQVTIRGENLEQVSKRFLQVVEGLEKIGATPERRWEAMKNGNGANGKEPKNEGAKACRKCGGMNLKLIKWNRNGKQMQAYKCLDCGAWQ